MRLSKDELALLTEACQDRFNGKAQELINLTGLKSAGDVVRHIALLPPEMQTDLEIHVRESLAEQKARTRRS